jgi:dihydroneopterin aldolase
LKDKIFIKNLVLPCHVGLTEEERRQKQNVIFDIEISCDLRQAGATDDINQTVNYYEIKETILNTVEKEEIKLLEHLAETVATIVLKDPAALGVRVAIKKEKYASSPEMGIEISRDRHG